MSRIRVGVLRGGLSSEYEVSLKTGGAVLKNLDTEKYHPHDILIDKNGEWFLNGRHVVLPDLGKHVDVVFNALHGHYGEDGQVQRELERYGVPYTGSGVGPSATAMHKELAKDTFRIHDILTPVYGTVSSESPTLYDDVVAVFRALPGPYVVKPVSGGSSLGTSHADSFSLLIDAVKEALAHGAHVMIEQRISGVEATCGVVEHFRGEELYALPPVEIVPDKRHAFFSYEAKYDGSSREICPATFSQKIKDELQHLAKKIHRALGLRHYSRSDFIVSRNGIYALEVNTLPGLTAESLLPKSLMAVGATLPEFLDHVVTLAHTGR